MTLDAKDGEDSYQMFLKVLVIKSEPTNAENATLAANNSTNATESATTGNETA